MSEFKDYPDYNIYKYGNLLISYSQIRNFYSDYYSLKKASNYKIEDIYMHHVRYVANYILSNNK